MSPCPEAGETGVQPGGNREVNLMVTPYSPGPITWALPRCGLLFRRPLTGWIVRTGEPEVLKFPFLNNST